MADGLHSTRRKPRCMSESLGTSEVGVSCKTRPSEIRSPPSLRGRQKVSHSAAPTAVRLLPATGWVREVSGAGWASEVGAPRGAEVCHRATLAADNMPLLSAPRPTNLDHLLTRQGMRRSSAEPSTIACPERRSEPAPHHRFRPLPFGTLQFDQSQAQPGGLTSQAVACRLRPPDGSIPVSYGSGAAVRPFQQRGAAARTTAFPAASSSDAGAVRIVGL